jgi:hypothetical protein
MRGWRHDQRFGRINRRRGRYRLRDWCGVVYRAFYFQVVGNAIVESAEMGVGINHNFNIKLLPGGFLSPILRIIILIPIEATANRGNPPTIANTRCSVQSCRDLWSCPFVVFEGKINRRSRPHKFRRGGLRMAGIPDITTLSRRRPEGS